MMLLRRRRLQEEDKSRKHSGGLHILRTAIVSRLLVLTLICSWRSLFPPYDTSSSLDPPCLFSPDSSSPPPLLPRLAVAIDRSIVWDSVYFVRIAQCGYEYEQTYAFFPALPVSMRLLARTIFAPLLPVLGRRAVLALSGYTLSNVAFVAAAVFLYRLSALILDDDDAAVRASTLFCFNPASVFYSSIYSESLYALFAFGGLYYLYAGSSTIATVLVALSGSARSNGMLNAGYFCFQAMQRAYWAISQQNMPFLAMQEIVSGLLRSVCVTLPFISFQAYGYFNICYKGAVGELRPWCKAMVPRLYDYVQSHYWGVGFLKYFQVKQVPNFLLASPILYIAVCSVVKYSKMCTDIVFSLGLRAYPEENTLMNMHSSPRKGQDSDNTTDRKSAISSQSLKAFCDLKQRKQQIKPFEFSQTSNRDISQASNRGSIVWTHQGYFSILVLPFIYHLAFLALTAFLVMHVQVATRFLSSNPPLYWYAAYLFASSDRRTSYIIWAYSSAYILLGSLLFSNFYPFT